MEVTEVRQEAERRHQLAIQHLDIATNMSVQDAEHRAQQSHEEIVASLENQIALTEFQAYARYQRLLTEPQLSTAVPDPSMIDAQSLPLDEELGDAI